MPRLLRRLSIAFAVLAAGLVLAGWVAMRVIATNVLEKQTEPVKQQLVADWNAHADGYERDLLASAAWGVLAERTPAAIGCELRWQGEPKALKAHLARCGERGAPVPADVLETLHTLGDDVVRKTTEAPMVERDFGWMAQLHGHDDWSQADGTPLEFVELDPAKGGTVLDVPVLDVVQVRALASLRLLAGVRAGDPAGAAADVSALARALLGRPVVIDQLVGITLLEHLRAQLASIERLDLAPREEEVKALRGSRLASAMIWHPWVPSALRARFLSRLPPASRCTAAGEVMLLLELGEPVAENYPTFLTDFAAWREGACTSDFINRGLALRTSMPKGSWQRAVQAAPVLERSALGPSLVVRAAESSPLVRRAALETLFTVMVARPFPPATP